MNFSRIITILFLSSTIAYPKEKEKVEPPPQAPLPDRVLQAKTVLLTSEGDKLAYDEAYKDVREWGRFQVVGDPEKADLVLVVRTEYASRTLGLSDTITGIWHPVPPWVQAQSLIVVDPRTNLEIWSERQVQRAAVKPKNREKETILAVDALVQRLRDRISAK